MIHARDGDFGVAVVWPECGLRCVPGPSQGAERQHRHGGFRFGGVRHVLDAERVISVLPADAGEGPRTVELPDLVRNRENPVRQLHQGHARRRGPCSARALLPTHRATAGRTRDARGVRSARRQNAHRPRRDRVFLQPEDHLPALPDAQAQQRQDRELSFHAGRDRGRAGTLQGRSARARVHRQTGRRREAGLRAQRRQTLARQARRAPEPLAPGVSRRRSVRLPERGREARRQRRGFHLHLQGDLAQGAHRLHRRLRVRAPRGQGPQGQDARNAPLPVHRKVSIEKVPLRDGKDAVRVNGIGFEISDAKGAVKYKTAVVTSLPVTKANVAEIVGCGRARWKIENESFNVLKNHGYELEHNFGHGEAYLAMTLAALNMLAFAWHTVLDLIEPPWRRAREAAQKRTRFFAYLATLTSFVVFPAWPDLLEALATFTIPPHLLSVQKIE